MTAPEKIAAVEPATAPPSTLRLLATQISTGIAVVLAPAGYFASFRAQEMFHLGGGGAALVAFWIAALLLIAGWAIAEVPRPVKIRALAFLVGGIIVAMPLYTLFVGLIGFRPALSFLSVIAQGLALSGWLILRQRRLRAFAALPIVILSAASGLTPSVAVGLVILVVVPAIAAWVAFLLVQGDGAAEKRAAAVTAAHTSRIEANAQAIRDWQAAYELANPGQPVPVLPPNFLPSATATLQSDRTNTLAVLAFVFGVLGGYLAIVFGHIAKSQIKRTGERGSGLATAGLVLGYAWVTGTVVFWVVLTVLVSQH